jgi:hypothetical protein
MTKLSAEVFEQIVASLRSDRSLRSNEKRRRPRVGLRSTIDIKLCAPKRGDNPTIQFWVRDVSADGMGLVGTRSLEVGTEFVADFDRFQQEHLRVKYRVAYCKMLSRGLYSIGAKLVLVMPNSVGASVRRAPAATGQP